MILFKTLVEFLIPFLSDTAGFVGHVAVDGVSIYLDKRIGWPMLMLQSLREFFLKRISNLIGVKPYQLLMKCVRVGRSAIFNGLSTLYKV